MSQNRNFTGAWAELVAAEQLMLLGFEVFRNVAQHGEHDLVALDPKTLQAIPIDVTLGRWRQNKSGPKILGSGAGVKLRSGKKHTVLVITPERELYEARLDKSKGIVYQQENGYPVVYQIVTAGLFKRP